jgi:Putative amidoligase enzyme
MGSGGRSRPAAGNITPTIGPPPAAAPAPPGTTSRATAPRRRGGAGGQGPPAGGQAGILGSTAGVPPGTAGMPSAAAGVLAGAADERAMADAARDLARDRWPAEPEVSYVNDPAAFDAAYREARARRARGEEPVPYMLQDATGGLGTADGGRPFGVEIEFDIEPGVSRYEALAAIGRDLHAAGLTTGPQQRPYHSGARAPARQHSGGWRFETDATVDGEIVSPVMHDTPETWRNLAAVCDIVRRHGGRATARTGGHVHVGLSDYDHTVENHNRLLATAAGYWDTLYRLAQNPSARRHRGVSWCRPNRDPGRGYTSLPSVRQSNYGHNVGVNFQSVAGTRADHVEFRMWDGSLNPGVIQAQVNLSLGLTAAGSRGGYDPPPAPEHVGTHRTRNPGRERLRGEEWRESTRSFRHLADTVFRRSANSAQAAALFAVTRWQR